MGIKDKWLNFVAPMDEDEDYEYDDDTVEQISYKEQDTRPLSAYEPEPKKTKINRYAGDTKMVLFEPRSFEEAEEIATHLKNRRTAVVNLHRLPRDFAQRTIDFLTGVVYALDGTIQKVGHNVILCSPKANWVDGEISLEGDDE